MLEEYVDTARQLTVHSFNGPVSASDLLEAVQRLYASGPTPNHLWDLAAADLSSIRREDLENIARLAKQTATPGRKGRTAIVAPGDLGFGFSRMYSTLAELTEQSVEVRSFRSRDEAEAWIEEGIE